MDYLSNLTSKELGELVFKMYHAGVEKGVDYSRQLLKTRQPVNEEMLRNDFADSCVAKAEEIFKQIATKRTEKSNGNPQGKSK